jgi:hypothetical protein
MLDRVVSELDLILQRRRGRLDCALRTGCHHNTKSHGSLFNRSKKKEVRSSDAQSSSFFSNKQFLHYLTESGVQTPSGVKNHTCLPGWRRTELLARQVVLFYSTTESWAFVLEHGPVRRENDRAAEVVFRLINLPFQSMGLLTSSSDREDTKIEDDSMWAVIGVWYN